MSNPYHFMERSYGNVADGNRNAAAAVDDASSGSSAGGVLALGSSVSVNADLHRTVKQETAELDELCRKAKAGLDGESRTAREIELAQARADDEMKVLLDSSTRTLDSVHVGEQILREIKGTVLQPFHESNRSHNRPGDGGGAWTSGDAAGGGGSGHKTPMDHLRSVSAENWAITKAKRDDVMQRHKEQEEFKEKALQLVELMKELRMMEAEDDAQAADEERQLAELRVQQEEAEQALMKEKQRLRALEAAAKDAEAELVKARENKMAKIAAYESQKASNQQKGDEAEGRVEEARQRNAGHLKVRSDYATKMEEWGRKGDAAAAHLREVQALLDERKAHQDAADAIRAERLKVHANKTALEAELSALQGELDKQTRLAAKEQEKTEKIRQDTLAVDELYVEKCSTALKEEHAEMIKIVHDTEMLAKALQESADPPTKMLEEDLAATRELISQSKASTKAFLDELKSQKSRVADKKAAVEAQRATLAMLEEVRSNNAQVEVEIASLKLSIEDKARLEKEHEEKEFRLRVLREAAELLKQTEIKEDTALDLTSDVPTLDETSHFQNAEADELPGGEPIDSQDNEPPVMRLPMW